MLKSFHIYVHVFYVLFKSKDGGGVQASVGQSKPTSSAAQQRTCALMPKLPQDHKQQLCRTVGGGR